MIWVWFLAAYWVGMAVMWAFRAGRGTLGRWHVELAIAVAACAIQAGAFAIGLALSGAL